VHEVIAARAGNLDGGVQHAFSALPLAIRRQLVIEHGALRTKRTTDHIGP
jgi:hypothetical protein